jgi:hypothetical protein
MRNALYGSHTRKRLRETGEHNERSIQLSIGGKEKCQLNKIIKTIDLTL